VERTVNADAYSLLTIAKTEGAAELHLVLNVVLADQLLELLHNLTGAFDMTRASDTYCNFHDFFLTFMFIFLFLCARGIKIAIRGRSKHSRWRQKKFDKILTYSILPQKTTFFNRYFEKRYIC
jgi:hypothetical protein